MELVIQQSHFFASLFDASTPLPLLAWALAFFSGIYIVFASLVWFLARMVDRPIETRPLAPKQIRTEMTNSARSILLFGLGMAFPWAAYQYGWIRIDNSQDGSRILLEMLFLAIWNDVHFYALHRLLHARLRKTHATHHRSVRATPFAAYSMSSLEALLLGSVMPLAMLVHTFSALSLLFLPLWSLLINTLSHSNCDFFPSARADSMLGFIRHHQAHHSSYHGNYGFFFNRLDTWLGTSHIPRQK